MCVLPAWKKAVAHVKGAFKYLEDRLTDNCASPYHCQEQHRICGLLRAFNPSFAHGKVDRLWVQRLATLTCFAHIPNIADGMKNELPDYLQACRGLVIDHGDVGDFTTSVLKWWASHHKRFPMWAQAARIAFCLSPNSAACERVFSLLQCSFGANRDGSLADQVQASVMLRYNRSKR